MDGKFKNKLSLGDRIRRHRERLNLTRPKLAKEVGTSLSSLQSWEMNDREPQASMIIAIATALGITPSYLLTGDGEQEEMKKIDQVPSESRTRNISMIQSFNSINVSAGFGSFNEGVTEADGEEPYSDGLLQHLRVKSHHCAVFWANGNSMLPTISSGDQLLVDLSKKEVKGDDRIYLVQNGESVWVKRVRIDWDGVELISDNKAEYRPIKISAEEAQSLQIIGQVVHIEHSLV